MTAPRLLWLAVEIVKLVLVLAGLFGLLGSVFILCGLWP